MGAAMHGKLHGTMHAFIWATRVYYLEQMEKTTKSGTTHGTMHGFRLGKQGAESMGNRREIGEHFVAIP